MQHVHQDIMFGDGIVVADVLVVDLMASPMINRKHDEDAFLRIVAALAR